MKTPLKTQPPELSQVRPMLAGAYFYDSWQITAADPSLAPLDQYLRVMRQAPLWLDQLMALRNSIGRCFGLKDLGVFSNIESFKNAEHYRLGERVGIFTLLAQSNQEVLLGDDDKHLNVVVSVFNQRAALSNEVVVTITTVVHVKNCLGKLYMLPVTPIHHQLARYITQSIGR